LELVYNSWDTPHPVPGVPGGLGHVGMGQGQCTQFSGLTAQV